MRQMKQTTEPKSDKIVIRLGTVKVRHTAIVPGYGRSRVFNNKKPTRAAERRSWQKGD